MFYLELLIIKVIAMLYIYSVLFQNTVEQLYLLLLFINLFVSTSV